MTYNIVPGQLWRFPLSNSLWDDEEDWTPTSAPSGLSIAEDDAHVYIEAAIPGVEPKDVEITFDKGLLWIKGETKEEEKGKKYYRKATSSFSYRVAVPGDIDVTTEPEATTKHGVMTVTFAKAAKSLPKKIAVKTSK